MPSRLARLGLLGLACAAIAPPASASAIYPSWVDSTEVNEAYLSDFQHRFQPRHEILDSLFDPKDAGRLHQRFVELNDRFERKRVRGTFSTTDQAAEYDAVNNDNTGYGADVKSSIKNFQQTTYTERVKNAALADETITRLKGPLGVIFGIAAVYNGVPVLWKMTDQTKLTASTQKGRTTQMQVQSPVATTSFAFSSDVSNQSSPFEPPPADPMQHAERYKVGAARPLNFWELATSVSYGSTTNSVTTALTKPVIPHVTASIEQVHPMGSGGDSYITANEGRVRMDYSLNF